MTRSTELHRFEWNGILLEVAYEPQWLPHHILGDDLAHIEVRSIHPTDAPLPITETGVAARSAETPESMPGMIKV